MQIRIYGDAAPASESLYATLRKTEEALMDGYVEGCGCACRDSGAQGHVGPAGAEEAEGGKKF